jgi:murein DD-endopeptidase MepM/ murein hydrolase activator NlpD
MESSTPDAAVDDSPTAARGIIAAGIEHCDRVGREDLARRLRQPKARLDNPATVLQRRRPIQAGQNLLVNALAGRDVCPVDDDLSTAAMTWLYHHDPTGGVGSLGRSGRNDFGAPRAEGRRKHKGQDIMLAHGAPLYAVTSGTVRWDENPSAGTIVYLEGDDGDRYSYFHLSDRAGSDGMRVKANQVIGFVGNTGGSSGAHLHFEVRPGGASRPQVDPMPFLSGSITGRGGAGPQG